MSRHADENTISGELLPPEALRKAYYELGKVSRTPPTVGIFDSPTRCYIINKEWAVHVMGMVALLADVVSWQDAEDESYFAIKEILRFMQGMECMDFQLRQSPDDNCILQQTIDGGATWSNVFDFSQCATIQDQTITTNIQNQVTNNVNTFQDIYNDYITNYAGLPGDVHANLAPPSGDDSALRAALCNAVWELVRTACNSAIAYYRDTLNSSQQEANVLLAIATFTFTAIAIAAAIPSGGTSLVALAAIVPEIALGVGLGAGLANFLVDFYQQHTIDQFNDNAAQEETACFLRDCLEGTDVSLVDMRTCLDGTGLSTNGQAILDFIEVLMEHDSTYAAFLEKWSNNKEYADVGIDLFCPCETVDYQVWIWSFKNGLGDVTLVKGTLENGRVRGVDTGTNYEIELTMPFNPAWRVRGAALGEERVNSGFHGTGDAGTIHWRATPGTDVGNIASFPNGGFLPSGVIEQCDVWSPAPQYITGCNQIWVHLFASDIAGAQLYLDKVVIAFRTSFAKGGYHTDDANICF